MSASRSGLNLGAAPAGSMRLFQHQPRECGYLTSCIYSVDEVMYFGPRGFDCVCATSGPFMIRRFGAFAFVSAMPDDPQTDARRTRLNASTSLRLWFAIDRERRLPSIMEQSMHGRTSKGFVATDAASTLSLQSSRATIEAQILLQRRPNASAIVRAHQKFVRERKDGPRSDFR
jgi:hypothetical protein